MAGRKEAAARQGEEFTRARDRLNAERRLLPMVRIDKEYGERLGIVPDEIAGSHCVTLSRPKELADMLESYTARQPSTSIGE